MMYLRYDKSIKCKSDYSVFISFKWNQSYIDMVKSIPGRQWVEETKEWEIPYAYDYMLDSFGIQLIETNPRPTIKEKPPVILDANEFKTKPYNYQLDGVMYGLTHDDWILGDVQGLGKTKQMIDLAVYKKNHEGMKHCLIICGVNNLKYNWVEEIATHSDEDSIILGYRKKNQEPTTENKIKDLKSCPEPFFWITNIETIRAKKIAPRRYDYGVADIINEQIRAGNIGMVVVDEIHKAKNPTSLQGRALLKINGCPKIGLSGTLLVSKPLDMYTPLHFINKMPMDYYHFQQRYVIKNYFGGIDGYKNMGELQDIVKRNMLRRDKSLLELPDKIRTPEYIEMSSEERKLYEEILSETKELCDKIPEITTKLAKLTRLRQICCHTALVSNNVWKSSKLERLKDILEDAKLNGEKVLVFSMFREYIKIALDEFKDMNPLHIWGQMNSEELNEQKDKFQNSEGFQVLFGQISAAGTGHTLNEASTVVFLDLPWDMATLEQAEDRAHRIGTKHTVNVILLMMKNTYDELLYKMILSKKGMGDILVDGKNLNVWKHFINCLFE